MVHFLKEGTVTLDARLMYFNDHDQSTDTIEGNTQESMAIGGGLGYKSGRLADFLSFGLELWGTAPVAFASKKRAGGDLLDNNQEGFAVVAEAYLRADHSKSYFTAYRQGLNTPFINADDSRMIPKTYEAYTLNVGEIEALDFSLGYVDKIKYRESANFVSMTAQSEFQSAASMRRGVWFGGVKWSPLDGLNIQGWEYNASDYMNILFLQADYSYKVSPDLDLHATFQGVDQRSTGSQVIGSFNAAEVGGFLGATYKGISLDLGLTVVDNANDVINDWGGYPFFTSIDIYSNNNAGAITKYLFVEYDFAQLDVQGLTISGTATWNDSPSSGKNAAPDTNEYDLGVYYKFQGERLKGLTLSGEAAYADQDKAQGGRDSTQVRIWAEYATDWELGD